MSVAARVVAVLEHLAGAEEPPTHTELTHATGLSKSTLTRILAELAQLDYVEHADRRYSTGGRLYTLGYQLTRQLGIPHQAPEGIHDLLERLARETGETVAFSVEVGRTDEHAGQMLGLDHAESPNAIRYIPDGKPVPIVNTAAGYVILAFTGRDSSAIPPEALQRKTPHTLVDPEAIDAELALVRRRGYACNFDGATEGVATIAAPWPDNRRPTGAISVSGPTTRVQPAERRIWQAIRSVLRG
jgi:IclR family acetate operon transcriptional repressor